MSGYIYLVQCSDNIGSNIYKIGRTISFSDRIKCYGKGSIVYGIFYSNNVIDKETEIINAFTQQFTIHKGREYFAGSINLMLEIASRICYPITDIQSLIPLLSDESRHKIHCLSRPRPTINDDILLKIFHLSDSKKEFLLLAKRFAKFSKYLIVLDDSQKQFISEVQKGSNIILEGPAGSGKSHCVRLLRTRGSTIIGMTEHAAGLIGGYSFDSYINYLTKAQKNTHVCGNRFVIDEAGLMTEMQLLQFDNLLRKTTLIDKLFGGQQVILVGDSLQIVSKSPILLSNFLGNNGFKLIVLEGQHRQINKESVEFMNVARCGHINERMRLMKETIFPEEEIEPLHIVPKDADKENRKMFNNIISKDIVFFRKKGDFSSIMPEYIELKTGCQVILLRHLPEYNLQYGSLGKIVATNEDKVLVKFNRKNPIYIKPITIEDTISGKWTEQIPLDLGWYRNITDIQGATLDKIIVHADKRPGYLYTALSRVRDIKNVRIEGDLLIDWCDTRAVLNERKLRTGPMQQIIEPIKINIKNRKEVTVVEIKRFHKNLLLEAILNNNILEASIKHLKSIGIHSQLIENSIRKRLLKGEPPKRELDNWSRLVIDYIWKNDKSSHEKMRSNFETYHINC